tara:strand:+ start:1015 stop:1347 length:333 start_codon:yes stop_codon:yes gene_type:complete
LVAGIISRKVELLKVIGRGLRRWNEKWQIFVRYDSHVSPSIVLEPPPPHYYEIMQEESGMGVKKLRLRKTKLDKHCEKMDSLVEAERNQRVQSEKDVVELTTEVLMIAPL